MIIERFTGKHAFLSNFHPCMVVYEGVTYPSTEHAYQAAKTLDGAERAKFWASPPRPRKVATAKEAKALGRKVTLRPDWEQVKVGVMREILGAKFAKPHFRFLLASTEDATLVEGTTWHDTFWGICTCSEHNGKGENWMGRLLTEIRTAIKKSG